VALLLVVVALALLGALALAAFGVASREQRGATDLMFATEAFEVAEGRLAAVEAGWDTTAAGLPVGMPHPGVVVVTSRMRSTATVTRLNATLYLVVVTGERLDGDGNVLARRRLGLMGRSQSPAGGGPAGFVPLTGRSWAQLYH